jgi:DNA-directed RNA polymerase specialized sigma24 family protein
VLTAGNPMPDAVSAEYAQWVERVRATFEAVQYTCAHRLADPSLAEQVSVQVVAGLVSRPSVFRYWGLPYSGRIARLAETRIAEADAGTLASVCGWEELRRRLDGVPGEHRQVLVAACVQGHDIAGLAVELGCDEGAAAARRAATLAFMHELASPGLPPAPDPDEKG